ncbi:MAG: SMC-Scp complex subunit ScpB [Phycisphaerales bacterium]
MTSNQAAPDMRASPSVSPSQAIEAILLTTDRPVTPAKLVDALTEAGLTADSSSVEREVAGLNESYESTGRAFRIARVAGGFRMLASPDLAGVLASFHGTRASNKLSRAALETLAVVAYRQPVTRAEIESIRGVAAGDVLRSLMDRRLLTIVGRAEELGRPMLYGTTKEFLTQFGLARLGDLPPIEGARPPPELPEPDAQESEPS